MVPRSLLLVVLVAGPGMGQDSRPGSEPWSLDAELARIRPGADDARWTTIPWRSSLTVARAEAGRTGKPVYLFVNDGEVGSGRC